MKLIEKLIERIWRLNRRMRGLIIFGRSDIKLGFAPKIRNTDQIRIGCNFRAGDYLWLEAVTKYGKQRFSPRITIKDNVVFNDNIHIGATNYVEIGNNVLLASKIYISDHNHGHYQGDMQSNPHIPPAHRPVSSNSKVIICDNVWIGEMVVILPGVCIGQGSIVGAGSVVTKSVPPLSIVAGSPARIIKQYDFELEKWVALETTL